MLPRLSPDGTRVALDIRDQENDIWIWDLARQTLTRLTDSPAVDMYPVWTPDGRRIIFCVGARRHPQPLLAGGRQHRDRRAVDDESQPPVPTSISPDGTRLIVRENVPKTGIDLRVLRMDAVGSA